MLISRFERIVLPDTEDGKFMANQYADDMRNAGMDVNVGMEDSGCITVYGHFLGDFDDEIVKRMKERVNESVRKA